MKVRFFDPAKGYLRIRGQINNAITSVLERGDLILRRDVEEFEKKLCNFLGSKYAVGVNSGTDALIIALRALGIGNGDEVITVSNTFKATITAIKAVGATPVFVDIGRDYLMDIDEVPKKITRKTKAIIPVHLSGDVCNLIKLKEVIRQSGQDIKIIEDAAQALGAKFDDIDDKNALFAGTYGDIGCFSFYPAKILGAYGDAGALVTDNEEIYKWAKNYRNHCKDEPGEDGMNSRLDNIQASVLNVKFDYLNDFLDRREEVATMYDKAFEDVSINLPVMRWGRVWQDYIIRARERDALKDFLSLHGIETMVPPILPHEELYPEIKLKRSEEYNKEYLRLPCNPEITNEEVEFVIKVLRKFYDEESMR
jgi:dTDP-4-amino-4,6-dideoxygalactose transaminase